MRELSPAEEDPVVDGYLAGLARPSPRAGMANRVLVNVWKPRPAWLRSVQARYDELVESGRIWFVVGAFAAGSLIPIMAMAVGFAVWGNQIAWGIGEVTPELWGAIVTGWNAALSEASRVWSTYMPSGGAITMLAVGSLATTVICSVGLIRMVRLHGKTQQ